MWRKVLRAFDCNLQKRFFHQSSVALKNFMVAVDGSEYSQRAFREAKELVRPDQDTLYIFTVPEVLERVSYETIETLDIKEVIDDAMGKSQDLVNRYVRSCEEMGVEKTDSFNLL
eukprot:TRINITY_DN11053_c0_g1_i1.p1 TRINITY_DN11053_c0_g1~~TRINITY_DN11053_c0_g1_i1.p1  ORF type:complete len:115 (+),score=10.71 TRINITY_DN11053_c0_g1_i1:21-365(+)